MNDPRWIDAMKAASDARRPSADQVARVQARLSSPPPSSWGSRPWLAGAALIAAGVALWVAWPAGPPVLGTVGEGSHREVTLNGQLAARLDGQGEVALGDDGWLEIDWVVGTVTVEPGVRARVHTREAEAVLAEGGASVSRDVRGTRAAGVALGCLGASESGECLPTSAAGWLGRARALQADGAADAALASIAAGLADGTDGSVAVELHLLRAELAFAEGERVAARAAAEAGLALGAGDRAITLHRFAARAALLDGDCSGALVHLDNLGAELTDEERAHRDRCRSELPSR